MASLPCGHCRTPNPALSAACSSCGADLEATADSGAAYADPPAGARERSFAERLAAGGRFQVVRTLGAGAFGVVFEAWDRQAAAGVALKTLRRPEEGLYRFKREFRTLADIAHPNLVRLLELLREGDDWFFTMELLEGCTFLEHVRGPGSPGGPADPPTLGGDLGADGGAAARDRLQAEGLPFHEGKLRSALPQLAAGLAALHAAGCLHRDVKPSNALVTGAGRVVLLDFGLATELAPEGGSQSLDIVGTPAYMSPEQAAGLPLTEATDWYSTGVLLYECLTGRQPFGGPALSVVMEKQRCEPPPPEAVVPGLPEDLSRLCRALLRRDPAARPRGAVVLSALGSEPAPVPAARRSTGSEGPRLLGRGRHLQLLHEAFARAHQGRTVVVSVRGASGAGKSSLLKRFLEEVRGHDGQAVILAGRCYESESVPYKALDGIVDALSHYLRRQDLGTVEALLPRDLLALVRLFPVLRQVPGVVAARRRVLEVPDSQELRRRGFAALRELLARLGEGCPLLLAIDDLQWSDLDSVALLDELLRPPDPPPMLLVCAHRTDAAQVEEVVKAAFDDLHRRASEAGDVRDLEVGALGPEEARALALDMLGGDALALGPLAAEIAREAAGSPFFVGELVQHFRSALPHPVRSGAPATLEGVIEGRVARLPPAARRLLEVVAVAAQPVELPIAGRAADLSPPEQQEALALLRAGHFVRAHGARGRVEVECQHDRIRVTVFAGLDRQAARAHHRALALALAGGGAPDPEVLAAHFFGAGDDRNAAEYAVLAAHQAREALAFDRAARLYALALDLQSLDEEAARRLRLDLGDALANAGRGDEAARAYLAAAAGAPVAHRLDLQRRAAEQFLMSGHIDEGSAALREVLASIGLHLAATPGRALLSLLFRRAWIAVRGLGFQERDTTQVSAEDLMRIDTCWAITTGLAMVDTIRGADFGARHLLLSLEAGEPYRVARALAMEVGYSATGGGGAGEKTGRLIRQARALAERLQHPHALALTSLTAGFAAFLRGEWREARALCEQAEVMLRERCTGVAWERDNAQLNALLSIFALGELAEVARRVPLLLKEAQDRGDLYIATSLRTRVAYVLPLAAGRPAEAREEVGAAIARWSQDGFHLQHLWATFAACEIDLFEGRGGEAGRRLAAQRPALRRSLLLRIQNTRILVACLTGRAALAEALEGAGRREACLAAAAGQARALEREGMPWARGLALLLRAGVDEARGGSSAPALYAAAEAALRACDMGLHAAAAQAARGHLAGGAEGETARAAAAAWMAAQGVRDEPRLAGMLAPRL